MSKKVRILSLDGGGIRGVIPAVVLEYIEKQLIEKTNNQNARIADYFDMIVGTSTGGILGCFYLTPNPKSREGAPKAKYTASKALDFYAKKGKSIFNESKKSSWFGLRQLFNATKYNPKTLEKIFREEFEDVKMHDLLKPCIVTTYDMVEKTSFFFSSKEEKSKRRDFYVRDVVRSTSAAPTYFPPAQIENQRTGKKMINVDGGVFANNPAMCAYAESRTTIFRQKANPGAENMLLLSIGTGGGQIHLPDLSKSRRWGVINWASSAPEIMMDGSIDTVDYQLKHLFQTLQEEHKLNYKRIDVPLDKRSYSPDMADASDKNINDLKTAGREALMEACKKNNTEHPLDKFIDLLIENNPD